jgi:hypothetical protein
MTGQGEFNFDRLGEEDGYSRWLTGRQVAVSELARRLNLPLGHKVEVWLCGGVRLRGKLCLSEDVLVLEAESVRHMQLKIERVVFSYREMESCVRLD